MVIFAPVPPKDFGSRACGPLNHGDSSIGVAAAKKIMGSSSRQQRSLEMASYPVDGLPSWVRHHAGEAWCIFCEFIVQGGTIFIRELDDSVDVCVRLVSMPENLLDRLEPSFIALEREADPDGFFRNWYLRLRERYNRSMETVNQMSGSDNEKRYRHSARVVRGCVPEFTEFFDSLREFIGYEACLSSRWRQGDASRKKWNMELFERYVFWGGTAA